MAKRFIDTNIFRKDFVRGLDAPYKLLWIYILNECDHAGLWDVEMDVAQARLKLPDITEKSALAQFGEKVVVVGNKWFIRDFIEFQYGELNPANRAHNSVIQILKKYNLDINKPLTSPLQGCKDMDKEQDKEKDKENIDESFETFWQLYAKNVDRKATEKAWKRIKKSLHDTIYAHVREYVASTPDVKFRKNPASYLNANAWENEIIRTEYADSPPLTDNLPPMDYTTTF